MFIKRIIVSILISMMVALPVVSAWKGNREFLFPISAKCGDIQSMMNKVITRYGEQVVFIGEYDNEFGDQTVMLWNKRSKTFTVLNLRNIERNGVKEPVACIVAAGTTELDFRVMRDWDA